MAVPAMVSLRDKRMSLVNPYWLRGGEKANIFKVTESQCFSVF